MGYRKGRNFEYEVKKYLESLGWFVRRSYASKGIFDLIAYKDGEKWGIQCKDLKQKNKSYLPPKERDALITYHIDPQVPYEFVSWSKKYQMPLLELLNDTFQVIHAYKTESGIIGWRRIYDSNWANFIVE